MCALNKKNVMVYYCVNIAGDYAGFNVLTQKRNSRRISARIARKEPD